MVDIESFKNTFIIQVVLLVVFVLIMIYSKLTEGKLLLKKWHGWCFLVTYALFVIYCFVDNYA